MEKRKDKEGRKEGRKERLRESKRVECRSYSGNLLENLPPLEAVFVSPA